jgi:hypothetical protein
MPRNKKAKKTTQNKFRDEMAEAVKKHGPLLPTGIAAALIGISRQALYEIMTRHRYAYVVVRTPDARTHNLIPLSTCTEIINERKTRQKYIYGSGYQAIDKPPIGGSVEVSQMPATNAKAKRRR